MKSFNNSEKVKLKTRAELINCSRPSVALDKLPKTREDMFDFLLDFDPKKSHMATLPTTDPS